MYRLPFCERTVWLDRIITGNCRRLHGSVTRAPALSELGGTDTDADAVNGMKQNVMCYIFIMKHHLLHKFTYNLKYSAYTYHMITDYHSSKCITPKLSSHVLWQ